MFDLATFIKLAGNETQTLTFPTKKAAVKYRLRLYNEKNKYKNLLPITIILREKDNSFLLIAGPEGFDLIEPISKETLEKMALLEKQEREEFSKIFDTEAKQKEAIKKVQETSTILNNFDRTSIFKKKLDPFSDGEK